MPITLFDELKSLLQQDPRLTADSELLKNQILELALKLDKDLLRLLLSNERIKEHFFADVDGVLVFDREKFMRFVSNKEFLPDSFTTFKNKIGLTTPEGHYLSESKEVVLSWPYKDCVLEGGQDKEDAKRNEIFWNEILAPDEIDRLLAPKILTNFKWYNAKGEHRLKTSEVSETSEVWNDNLIIKGNNLLALHSLKKRFGGKVKLIYIDPPYNTGNDSFGYNDSFNHSSWLTFMKNRLEIAKALLHNDGSIWINIDDDEGHYLKVLCDDIFGRDNFVANVIWEKKYSPQNDAKWLSDSHDHILVYARNKQVWRPNLLPRTEEMNRRYKNLDNDPRGLWKSSGLDVKTYSETYDYPIKTPSGRIVNPPKGYSWRVSKGRFEEWVRDNRIWFGKDGNNVPSIKRFLSEVQEGTVSKTIWFRDEVGDNQEAKQETKKFWVMSFLIRLSQNGFYNGLFISDLFQVILFLILIWVVAQLPLLLTKWSDTILALSKWITFCQSPSNA